MLYVDHVSNDTFFVVDTDDLSYESIDRDYLVEAVNNGLVVKNLQGNEFYPYKDTPVNYADTNTVVVQMEDSIVVWFRGYFYSLRNDLNDECLYINDEATPFGSMYSWFSMRSVFKRGDSLFLTLYNHSVEFTSSGLAIIIIRETKDDEDEDLLYTTKIKSPVIEIQSKRKVIQGIRKPLASIKKVLNKEA